MGSESVAACKSGRGQAVQTWITATSSRIEGDPREIGKDVEQGERREFMRRSSYRTHERSKVRIGLEEIAQCKDVFSASKIDTGDHQAETTRAKLAASKGKVAKSFYVVSVAHDPLEDLPGEYERHGGGREVGLSWVLGSLAR